jgi:hypothetical protein
MPRTYTFEEKHRIQELVLNALDQQAVANLGAAAALVEVPRQTLRRWAGESPDFGRRLALALENSRESAVDDVEQSVFEQAKKNFVPAFFVLKAHRKALYGETQRQQGPAHITVQIDKAQLLLAHQTDTEMRRLESAELRSSEASELEADESDTWAVRQ